jgi:uncharacterized protein YbjT (DUF2867 family)
MKRVLVAGATGYLGRHVVTELKRRGYWVRVLVRHPDQAVDLAAADHVFVGRVVAPASIENVAAGTDTVMTTIGITKPTDRSTYEQVDYGGNLALLREAQRCGVGRFGYVALFDGPRLRRSVHMVAAKERFVDTLLSSSVPATVIRPTGFFSDMRAFLDMAERGRSFLVGSGTQRINPISGHDLADAFVTAMETGTTTMDIGGPETFTHDDIARLATRVAARRWRVTHMPPWLLRTSVNTLRLIAPQRIWGPLEFFAAVMATDMVAPTYGSDSLGEFFTAQHNAYQASTPTN